MFIVWAILALFVLSIASPIYRRWKQGGIVEHLSPRKPIPSFFVTSADRFQNRVLLLLYPLAFVLLNIISDFKDDGLAPLLEVHRAAQLRAPLITLSYSIFMPFYWIFWATLTAASAAFLNINAKHPATLAICVFGAGTFTGVISVNFADRFNNAFMTYQGYSRCAIRDFRTEQGRQSQKYVGYVPYQKDCFAKPA